MKLSISPVWADFPDSFHGSLTENEFLIQSKMTAQQRLEGRVLRIRKNTTRPDCTPRAAD